MSVESLAALPALPEIEGAEVRHVEGYPGYAVSDDGRVWSCRRVGCIPGFWEQWRCLIPSPMPPIGYLKVSLVLPGHRNKKLYVHRLVIRAFRGAHPSGCECCHENGIVTDNRAVNLRWDTRRQNLLDKIKHGTNSVGERAGNHKLTDAAVAEIRRTPPTRGTVSAFARRFSVTRTTVRRARDGQNWRHL